MSDPTIALAPVPTEQRNPRTIGIDLLPTAEIVALINAEDATVPGIVAEQRELIAAVVDRAVDAIRRGGRIHYFGAGTSGRLAVLDAAEVPPTYGADPSLFVAHIAGGDAAMTSAVEDAEDRIEDGVRAAADVTERDIVIGLAASGRTPYVLGALQEARRRGAFTVAITSNPAAPMAGEADVHIGLDTGPEVITGSTRMKAGTSQKLALHTLSTAMMIRLGRTYSNLMIDVVATNQKLRLRVTNMLQDTTGASYEDAAAALDEADGEARVALVALLTDTDVPAARTALRASGAGVREGIRTIRAQQAPGGESTTLVGIDVGASGFRIDVASGGPDGSEAANPRRLAIGAEHPAIIADRLQLGAVLAQIAGHLDAIAAVNGVPASIAMGVAGGSYYASSLPAIAAALRAIAPQAVIRVFPDSLGAFVSAFGFGPGAVLAAGTGAVAVASDGGTRWRQVDGDGYLLGDRGSGAWIGRSGLESAIRSAGTDAPATALLTRLEAAFGDTRSAIRALHAAPDRGTLLASFAPAVFAAAQEGDPAAQEILSHAADELARTAIQAARDLTEDVALVGGVFAGSAELLRETAARIEKAGFRATASSTEPSRGAVRIAAASATMLPPAMARQIVELP